MKIKSDFVTNSSSASFVIGLHNVTEFQRMLIRAHAFSVLMKKYLDLEIFI
jgi:hypothetical protein